MSNTAATYDPHKSKAQVDDFMKHLQKDVKTIEVPEFIRKQQEVEDAAFLQDQPEPVGPINDGTGAPASDPEFGDDVPGANVTSADQEGAEMMLRLFDRTVCMGASIYSGQPAEKYRRTQYDEDAALLAKIMAKNKWRMSPEWALGISMTGHYSYVAMQAREDKLKADRLRVKQQPTPKKKADGE